MGDFRFVMKPGAVRKILKSPEVRAEVSRRAHNIAKAAGEGMEVSVRDGTNRVRGTVITATTEARVAEATHRKLSRSFDAGRG
jgi:hypothetical protein